MPFTERKIIFYGHHFMEFFLAQTTKVQEKIEFVLRIIKQVERVPASFLKHMEATDGLYEIRVEHGSNIFRIFCCFDRDFVVVLFNGFRKKSGKTPAEEMMLAKKLLNEYRQQKDRSNEKGKHKKR